MLHSLGKASVDGIAAIITGDKSALESVQFYRTSWSDVSSPSRIRVELWRA